MSITVEEKSLELALVKAARELGVTQSELGYQVLKSTDGFLGLFGRKVELRAWRREAGAAKAASAQRSNTSHGERRGATSRACRQDAMSESEVEDLAESLRIFLQELACKLAGRDVEVLMTRNSERLILDIDDGEVSEMLVKNSKLAESLEHVVRKVPRHLQRELPFRLFVDAQSCRQDREAELESMARDLSDKVFQNRRPIVLNYRSSYDRKIIHMALDGDERVYTKSIGTGPSRKLMILPARSEDTCEYEGR